MNIVLALNDIRGVIGSAVFDSNNECVMNALPAPFEPILVAAVVAELRTTVRTLGCIEEGGPFTALVVELEEGYLVMRAVETMIIVVLAQTDVNPSMLSVGLSVASLKLGRPELGGVRAASSPDSARPSTPGPAGSVSGLSSSGYDIRPASPDALGGAVLNAFLKVVAKQMGPFAKIAVKEELKKLGATPQTLGRSQYEDLVAMVARRLPDPAQRKEFVADAERLVPKS